MLKTNGHRQQWMQSDDATSHGWNLDPGELKQNNISMNLQHQRDSSLELDLQIVLQFLRLLVSVPPLY